MRLGVTTAIFLVMAGAPVLGQWIHVTLPDTPRTADGKPNLSAPAPKTPDGKPDFSGIWQVRNRAAHHGIRREVFRRDGSNPAA